MHHFDPDESSGQVVTDEGLILPFGPDAVATSGLRHVRQGQRLSIQVEGQGSDQRVVGFRLGIVGQVPEHSRRTTT